MSTLTPERQASRIESLDFPCLSRRYDSPGAGSLGIPLSRQTPCQEGHQDGRTAWVKRQQACTVLEVCVPYRLVGLVVRRPPRERKIPGSNPACARIFSGSSHTNDSKIGTPVATLPGAWRDRVSAGTGRPGVSILR